MSRKPPQDPGHGGHEGRERHARPGPGAPPLAHDTGHLRTSPRARCGSLPTGRAGASGALEPAPV
jgi:hypothetical protein